MIFNKILKIMFGNEEEKKEPLTIESFDKSPLNPKQKARKNGTKKKKTSNR